MAFEQYFERIEYYLEKSIGISLFNSSSDLCDNFLEKLNLNNIQSLFVKASDIAQDGIVPDIKNTQFQFLVFNQDLTFESLADYIEIIINDLIFPVYYQNKSIAFFTSIEKSNYDTIDIKSGLIHTDIEKVVSLLQIEQLYELLKKVNIEHNDWSDFKKNIVLTPIEKIIQEKLEENKLSYRPQVKLGRFYVDFLVEKKNKKIIVECDGRDYHNLNNDKERDKELKKLGFPILRLTGSEIFNFPDKCIEKINQTFQIPIQKKAKSIDKELDESQIHPLNHIVGPCRVLAPAGSGKTKTLVNRIANLINQGIDENKILALAFNKEAANEMSKRLDERNIIVSKKISEDGVAVRTFHSFGFELIRDYLKWRFKSEKEVIDTRNFLKQAFTPFIKIPGYKINDAIDKTLEALRKAKMELIPIQEVTVEIEDNFYSFQDIFYKYLELQKNHNFFNFDDMIYLALRIILDNRTVRKSIQNRFQYILVDEFQDLTEAQLLLMQVLSLPDNNLFIVGDDDQMIYGWRGAKISHIIDFPKRYKTSKDYTLSTNYRCTKKVVKHSNWLINNNLNRVEKNIKPKLNAEQGQFEVKISENIYEQAVNAVEWIKHQHETSKYNWSDFTVLYRYHEYQYPVAMILDSYKIPHSPVNKFRLFFKNPGKDLYSYLTVIMHPADAKKSDFERILKRPNKYFTNNLISYAVDWDSFENLRNIPSEKWRQDNVSKFVNQVGKLKSKVAQYKNLPQKIVQEIFDTFGFVEYYKDESAVVNEVEKAGDDIIIEVLISVSKLYNSLDDFYADIYKAVNDPFEKPDEVEKKQKNEVQLSTIHSTKGNEFTNVVYFNLSQFENPPVSEVQIEEERRVCYVGITRAIKNILITTNKDKYSNYLIELIRNPEFVNDSNIQLNNLLVQIKSDEELILGNIEHHKKEIDAILLSFPELNGKSIQIDKNLIGVFEKKKIETLEKKYPEITGAPLKSNFLILKKYFINRRLQGIDKAKIKIDRLNHEIEKKIKNEADMRKSKINEASENIDGINRNILELSNNELVICRDKRTDIESELRFRELIPIR